MNDLAGFFAFFVIIYAAECVAVVPRHAVAVLRGARSRMRRALCPNATWSSGFVVAGVLPTLSPPFLCEPLQVVLGPQGVAAGADHPHQPWAYVRDVVAHETNVTIAGERFATFATTRNARAVADLLARVALTAPAARAEKIAAWLEGRFDVRTADARVEEFTAKTRWLRRLTNTVWLVLFVAIPIAAYLPIVGSLTVATVVLFGLWIAVIVVFRRLRRRFPQELWPPLGKRLSTLGSPIGATRTLDPLAHNVCGDLDPLAVFASTAPKPALAALARPRLVALRFGGSSAAKGPDETWWRDQNVLRIETLLRAQDVNPADLLAAPPNEGGAKVYCPLCLSQYASEPDGGTCTNAKCGDMAVVAFG